MQENVEQVIDNDLRSKDKYSTPITALHKFSSAGDVAALQSLFHSHPSLDVNAASRKSKNTALHYAVSKNQQGFIIDYLLSRGADPNRPNATGYTPMMLAIVNCNTSEALQKLLDAGAYTQLLKKEDRHAVLELAIRRNKNEAEQVLLRYIPSADDETHKCAHNKTISENSLTNVLPNARGKAVCPLCHSTVKFPSRMSFLPLDQKLSEDAVNNSNIEKVKKQLHDAHESSPQQPFDDEERNKGKETRVYLDLFLSSVAFTEMCKVEYHGVNNMHKLRKEVSESWAMLSAIQQTCHLLKLPSDMSRTMIIDLCSGKCLTTTLLSILYPKGKFLAVDKLPEQMVPHCASSDVETLHLRSNNRWYLSRDIRSKIFADDLEQHIHRHCFCQGEKYLVDQKDQQQVYRVPILVGMHLCGHLSSRAIELFKQSPQIGALILSPCCLPRVKERNDVSIHRGENGVCNETSMYESWAGYLKSMVEKIDDVSSCRLYKDLLMNSNKNCIVVASRRVESRFDNQP